MSQRLIYLVYNLPNLLSMASRRFLSISRLLAVKLSFDGLAAAANAAARTVTGFTIGAGDERNPMDGRVFLGLELDLHPHIICLTKK